MTSKGQITLPALFRKKMKLTPGQKVRVRLHDETITVLAPIDVEALRLETAAHLARHKFRPLTDEELDDVIDDASTQAAVERYERSFK